MEGVAEALYSVKKTARGLTPQKIREGLRTVAAESENIFSRCARQPPSREVLKHSLFDAVSFPAGAILQFDPERAHRRS